MKIQLVYDRPSQISTDLLVVILDSKTKLHDLTGNLLEETVRRVGRDMTEKAEFHKVEVTIAALKSHDQQNRHYLQRYTAVSDAVNEARDMINEPGSVATPEYLAEAARKIAKESDLDLKVWDEKKLQKEGYNGLLQVGRGSSHPPRLIRLAYRARKAKAHLAFVGKGVT